MCTKPITYKQKNNFLKQELCTTLTFYLIHHQATGNQFLTSFLTAKPPERLSSLSWSQLLDLQAGYTCRHVELLHNAGLALQKSRGEAIYSFTAHNVRSDPALKWHKWNCPNEAPVNNISQQSVYYIIAMTQTKTNF